MKNSKTKTSPKGFAKFPLDVITNVVECHVEAMEQALGLEVNDCDDGWEIAWISYSNEDLTLRVYLQFHITSKGYVSFDWELENDGALKEHVKLAKSYIKLFRALVQVHNGTRQC